MFLYGLLGILLTLPIYASSEFIEEEGTDLEYRMLLIEKTTYIDRLNEDYFALNKKRIDEKKEILKIIEEKDIEVEIMKKGHEDSITVLSRRLNDSQEKLNKNKEKKRLSQEKLNETLKKNEELEKEKNESWDLIHRMKSQIDELEDKNKEYFQILTNLQNQVSPYKPYKIFFNPARRRPHKIISNHDMESEKWLLTDHQAYIITHIIDNAVQIQSQRI